VKIPTGPADFDANWLNNALAGHLDGVTVESVTADYLGTPGQTADVVGVVATYSGDTDLPTRFVAKIAAKDESTLQNVVIPLDLYGKEYSFYDAEVAGINYPTCFYRDFNPQDQGMVLLMEDISHLDCPSWNATPQQVEIAVSKLAPFQARWWNNQQLKDYSWLTPGDDRGLFGMYAELSRAAIPTVNELADKDMSDCNALINAFHENLDGALNWVSGRPFTFVHGDYHPKQMFFGEPGTEEEFVMIDWQLPTRSLGTNDLARIIVLGLDQDTRRLRERELIESYHQGLKDNGVDYPMEELLDDYRFGIFVSLAIHYLAAATNIQLFIDEVTALGMDWRDVAYNRLKTALEDHDGEKLIAQWKG
jgi:hypothetical protein